MPSLHANLAGDYLKLRDTARASDHLASARRFVGELPDDAYGQLIRRGIDYLAMRLSAAEQSLPR
jgi:hypothetical protein